MAENKNEFTDFLLYKTPNNKVRVEIYVQNETVWLNQQKIADLFGVTKSTISEHLSNVFGCGELRQEATVRNFRTVQKEGSRDVTRNIDYYNLDAIISVGYRVNSAKATHFRIWATRYLNHIFPTNIFIKTNQRYDILNSFTYLCINNTCHASHRNSAPGQVFAFYNPTVNHFF